MQTFLGRKVCCVTKNLYVAIIQIICSHTPRTFIETVTFAGQRVKILFGIFERRAILRDV